MKEDKQAICDEFLKALWKTRDGRDVVSLNYIKTDVEEIVAVTFSNGYTKTANVACDSGIAMIHDIIRQVF